ncbi:phenylalanine--tRNA ligase subunit beta [Streptococcus sp. WM07]|uniref:phenylalanine--tRNA ligase subunit beta n=1 Tax=unclassified Streptococcus TaxID=2608887 RepID=UPI001072E95D|nr:phenylalanine--tRNA ligase subunit beta [Streptococcus sp. WM07]MBF0805462.1 phenylalanine--tRNA ligase subunit beta [Streptococcus sp. 19428wA2_WM07]TFU29076.1 phenylalanine--tRNA ligase subunit beta [Streptococcus sp. WM07]
MLVSYKWLKELVELDVPVAALAEKMSTTGIEVEGVMSPADGLSKIVVGHVLTEEAVPETHLHRCQVDVGEEEARQIVCGAPNIAAGQKVIVALPGARIADNYKIKKGKIRGMESLGMICSLAELGLSESIIPKEYAEGIQVLPADAIPGESVFPYLDMDDQIIELSITPNRADALSMRGVAYEVAAIYDSNLTLKPVTLTEVSQPASDLLEVAIESDKVSTYQARILENVQVAPSPQWLQNRLMNAGIRPINNVVDVTNLVLLEYGQPLHAFDLDTFKDSKIVVREARVGEQLLTLDGVERNLEVSDLVITVADEPVALAGVMGGQATEITKESKRVVLEAAVFDGTSIRKTSGRLNLRSEASARFEKGINVGSVSEALDYAASLLVELAGAEVLSGRVEAGEVDVEPVSVATDLASVNRVLGTDLDYAAIEDVFRRLGFGLSGDATAFQVSVPKRRWDITIPADLNEEIARIYGYDRLPSSLPGGQGTAGELTTMQALRRKVQDTMEGAGLTEVITYTLTTPEKAQLFRQNPSALIQLMWPMSVERSVLRQSMVSSLLETLQYNQARRQPNLAIYEIGKIFKQIEGQQLPQEDTVLALALTGSLTEKDFQTQPQAVDFFTAKGMLELLFDRLGLEVTYKAIADLPGSHPGRTALLQVGDQTIGFLGQVHPALSKDYDLSEVYVAEVNLSLVENLLPEQAIFQDISKFPSVTRDIALLVQEEVQHQAILDVLSSLNLKRLKAIHLFDVYQGLPLSENQKSMAYSLTFQNPEATMEDEEVVRYMDKIQKALESELGAEIR